MRDHVVLVGYGRVGTQIVQVLKYLGLSYLVVEQDAERASDLQKEGVHALFGDAANSEILTHANLDAAQALVVTVPNETTAELIVVAAHDLAPNLPIVARAGTQAGILRLMKHGANHVIQPELEGGLEIVRHTLLALNYPMLQIQTYVDSVRHDAYETIHNDEDQHEMLDKLVRAVRGVEIGWHAISAASPVVGQSLAEANIRNVIGASIVALMRENKVIPNPKSDTQLLEGDMVGLIGNAEQVEAAGKLLSP
jgi:CPA2 family monovalent cation:H+ antiporter-2